MLQWRSPVSYLKKQEFVVDSRDTWQACCQAFKDFLDDENSRILGYRFYDYCGTIPEWGLDLSNEAQNTKQFSLKSPGDDDMLKLSLRDCEKIYEKEDEICDLYQEGIYDYDCLCIANGSGGLGTPGGLYIQISYAQNQNDRSYVQTSLRHRDVNLVWECGHTRHL